MVAELVTKPEHEPRAYSVMPFVWSIGTIIGPAIGGTFADPVSSFPNYFSRDGLFGRFPYLLPNLLCATLLLISILAGYFLLEETHPDMQPRVMLPESTYVSDETPLMATADAIKTPAVDLRADTYGTFEGSDDSKWRRTKEKVKPPKTFTNQVIALIVALGIFTYHSMTFDHLLPIFLEDKRGEPLSSISLFNQSITSGRVNFFLSPGGLGPQRPKSRSNNVDQRRDCSFRPSCRLSSSSREVWHIQTFHHRICLTSNCIFHNAISSLSAPFVAHSWYIHLSHDQEFTIHPRVSCTFDLDQRSYASPCVLGKINGLAASAGAACRTIAPPVSGYLYTLGSRVEFTGLAWYGSAFVAGVGVMQCFMVKRERFGREEEEEWKSEGERLCMVIKKMVVQLSTRFEDRDIVVPLCGV